MKYIFLVAILLVVGGCSGITPDMEMIDEVGRYALDEQVEKTDEEEFAQQVEEYEQEMQEIESNTVEPHDIGEIIAYDGAWVTSIPDTFQGQEAVTDISIRFVIEGDEVTAGITATLSTDIAPAVRIDLVEGYGAFDDMQTVVMGWEGSREDKGRATIIYNLVDDTLEWNTKIYESTDYTLPEEMVLKRGE